MPIATNRQIKAAAAWIERLESAVFCTCAGNTYQVFVLNPGEGYELSDEAAPVCALHGSILTVVVYEMT